MRKKYTSILRSVREVTGMTQAKFAARIGSHKANVENYEMGRAVLPERLAARIGALVGVIPETLQRGEKPTSWDGEPFSAEKYQQWQSLGYLPKQVPILIHAAQTQLGLLLQAAIGTRNNMPHVFRELLIDLDHFIHSRAERLELTPVIEATMRANSREGRRRKTTVGELRIKFGDNAEWKAIDDVKLADSCEASIKITNHSLFRPFTGFCTNRGMPAFASLSYTNQQVCDIEIGGAHFRLVAEHVQANYLRPRYAPGGPLARTTLPPQ